MNIVIAAHAPWRQTGYGTPVMPTARALQGLGHNVALMAIEQKGPGFMTYEDLPVAMMDRDVFGQDIAREVCKSFKADAIISLFDAWMLREKGFSEEVSGVPWLAWTPVDQEPLALGMETVLPHARRVLVQSRWGFEALKRSGFEEKQLFIMPSVVDTDLFTPAADDDEVKQIRAMFELPDGCAVFGLIGSNLTGDRKALSEQIQGWSLFINSIGRDKARLLVNVEPYGAVPIPWLAHTLDCRDSLVMIEDFSRRYTLTERANLVKFYRALDALLHVSAAEGFGLCVGEAMACGVEVIYNGTTSMPEIVREFGVGVFNWTRTLAPQGGWWYRPKPISVAAALDTMYQQICRGEKRDRVDVREAVLQYGPASFLERWAEVLKELNL